MIEELSRRIAASPLGRVERPLVLAMQRAGLDPAVVVGALRLLAPRRIGIVHPGVVARLAGEVLRHGRPGPQALLRLHALTRPEDPALVTGDPEPLRLSYGALDERILRIAWALGALGVGPGDRVALMLPNGVEPIELPAALGWLGAAAVQVGGRLKPREVGYLLADSGARAFVFHADHLAVVESALAEAGAAGKRPAAERCIVAGATTGGASRSSGFVPYESLLAGPAPRRPPLPSGGGAGGLIIYTSGTTGNPKGAARDLRSMGFGPIVNLIADLPVERHERHLLVCPLYHSSGAFFSQMVMGLGGTLVVHRQFDPQRVLAAIERERITSLALVPTMLARLLAVGSQALHARDLSSLRWVMSLAAPLPTALARRAEEELGPILYNVYAATETGLVTLARPGEHTARPGTIGRPVLGNAIRLLDESGREVPAGAVGELCVRNAMMMAGYHNRPADTAAAWRDGFVSVGDLARVDGDGFYYLAGRRSDMVITGGVNVYPAEIEQRLDAHPAVAESAVVGYPDEEWGESLCAFVVLRPGCAATADELQRFVGAELADYKRPREVRFVAELPRTTTGKVLKRELRLRPGDEPG